MSMTPDEYAQEEWFSELYEEHRQRALEEFKQERLQSYFVSAPEIAKAPYILFQEARAVASSSPSAALVLAAAAAEVGVKSVFLKPIVVGLVHSDALAGHIADLVVQHQGIERFQELLFNIMREYGGMDLSTYRRSAASATLWTEIKENTARRNRVCHRCESATAAEATIALSLASEVLEALFPAFVHRLGLHLHNGYRCCNDPHFKEYFAKLLQEA